MHLNALYYDVFTSLFQVLKMLIMILATFGMCWIPLQVIILYSEFRNNSLEQVCTDINLRCIYHVNIPVHVTH